MEIIPIEDKRKCVEMANSGMTTREVYTEYYSKHYDLSFDSFKRQLKRWKKSQGVSNIPEDKHNFNLIETLMLLWTFTTELFRSRIKDNGSPLART